MSHNPLVRYQKYAPAVAEMVAVLEFLTQEVERVKGSVFSPEYRYGVARYSLGSRYASYKFDLESVGFVDLFERFYTVFTDKEQYLGSYSMFDRLSCFYGFYNFIPLYRPDGVPADIAIDKTDSRNFIWEGSGDFLLIRVFSCFPISETLSAQDWQQMRVEASLRAWKRLYFRSLKLTGKPYDEYFRYPRHQWDYLYGDDDRFYYKGVFDEDDHRNDMYGSIVTQIIDGEEERLRKFIEALRGTLLVLEGVKEIQNDKDSPPRLLTADTLSEFLRTLHSAIVGKEDIDVLLSPSVEEAQENNTKLSSYTPTSADEQESNLLSVPQPLKASVAAFLDYTDAFYESLELGLERVEEYEQSYEKMTSTIGRTKPDELFVSFAQYEGHYSCRGQDFFHGMSSLISLLYTVMRKGSQVNHETKPLKEYECWGLFNSIAVTAGFLLTLLANFCDNWVWGEGREKKYFNALDNITRLIDFTRPLREQDWSAFRSEAMKRVPIFIRAEHNSIHHDKDFPHDMYSLNDVMAYHGGRGVYRFSHHRSPTSSELNKVVSEIIDGEVLRFRRFIEAFHGTLQFLADAKPLAHTKIKPPVFAWDKRNEALVTFQKTIDLLRTVSTGGTLSIPQTQIVESSLAQNQSLAPSQTEELFTVEIEDIGAVIALSKRDAALIVFADAKYKRKKVTVTTAHGLEIVAYLAQQYTIDEDFYVAIFPRIPLQDGITEAVEVVCDKLRGKATLVACNTIRVFLGEE